jgi:hypothetical protein
VVREVGIAVRSASGKGSGEESVSGKSSGRRGGKGSGKCLREVIV